MAIYRGAGGSTDTTDQATVTEVSQLAAEAATSATDAASSASEAATSASTASSSKTAAATSATNAAASASTASQKASEATAASTTAVAAQTAVEIMEASVESAESNAILYGNMANTAAGDATTAKNQAEAAATSAQTSYQAVLNVNTEAAASADDAADSATAAATSATSAATSATTASTAATTATGAADDALDSELAAANSATVASSAASSATDSAASVAASVITVEGFKDDAETSATNASNSATTAANYASNASASADAAEASVSDAEAQVALATTQANNAASAASTASTAKDATLAALDSFDDRYLGAKENDPTLDNDGDALLGGSLYYNSTSDTMKVYDGSVWRSAYVSGDDYVLRTGDSISGNLNFGDNDKAVFGDGSDLQIYHDGFNSYIDEVGNGSLIIKADDFELQNATGTEKMVRAFTDSTVQLYFNNSAKLSTTSTGVDVTGTVTADGLTVEGAGTFRNNANENLFIVDTANTTRSSFQISGAVNYFNGNIDTASHAQFVWRSSNAYTERMRIDSSGNVGIGTSSPSNSLHISGTSGTPLLLERTNGAAVTLAFKGNTTTNNPYLGANGDNLYFNTGTSEAMRIDSSGKVGIGTSSPSTKLDVSSGTAAAATFRGSYGFGANNSNIRLINDGSTYGYISQAPAAGGIAVADGMRYRGAGLWTSDGTSSSSIQQLGGAISFTTDSGMTGGTNFTPSEAMRIDSSGNLLVGKTSASASTDGFEVNQTGTGYFVSTGTGTVGYLNRRSTDGDILEFRKDNTTVGSIGTNGGALTLGNDDAALRFSGASNGVFPFNVTTQSATDGTLNLGGAGSRFNNLYLSGGVYLGGTGAANKLDDYETGTWTPVDSGQNSLQTGTWSTFTGTYTKVGNTVTVHVRVSGTSMGFTGVTGYLRINGLPFATAASFDSEGTWSSLSVATGTSGSVYTPFGGNTYMWMMAPSNTTTSNAIAFSITYQTA